MTAPSIPNLRSLLGPGGGRSRGRGRGRGFGHATSTGVSSGLSQHHDNRAASDCIIQQTDNDAAGSRLSAVNQGYLADPFAQYFYKDNEPPRRFPIINRGTYVRTTAIDKIVRQFLDTCPDDEKQIISLGAGTDTRFFRIIDENPTRRLVYHELDFATNTALKISSIKAEPVLLKAITKVLPDPDSLTFGGNGSTMLSPVYSIHPMDLRTIKPTAPPTLPGISKTTATLILSECCLCYLSPEDNSTILDTLLNHILEPTTPAGIVIYEPIRPLDAFGKTMISNLASRGIHMQTIQQYENLTAQKARLRNAGFVSVQCASDVDFIFKEWTTSQEKQHVNHREMLDELEEWVLLARHYCIAWGARNGNNEHVLFKKAWSELPSQNDD